MKTYNIHLKRIVGILFLIVSLFGGQRVLAQTDMTTYQVTHDISTGPLTIAGTDTRNFIITGTTTDANNRVIIETGYKGTIKFRNLNITHTHTTTNINNYWSIVTINGATSGSGSAHYNHSNTDPLTKVTLVLEGTNNLIYRYDNTNATRGYCCLEVMQAAQIHIRSVDEADNSKGVLNALIQTRTSTAGSNGGGAAIGARTYGTTLGLSEGQAKLYTPSGQYGTADGPTAGGNIIISSGTIHAKGGHGAGIGGGYRTYYDGMIVIYGGDVHAETYRHSAGIGSGCPIGTGVLTGRYTSNSAVIVLPPAKIESYGAGDAGDVKVPSLALAGAKTIIYVNDPSKGELTIHTEDYEPDATIYADLTESPEIVNVFNTLELNSLYDLKAAKFGVTGKSGTANAGKLIMNAYLQQPITFFTDKSSSGLLDPAMAGRPYLPKEVTIPDVPNTTKFDIELEFLPVDIFMEIFVATSKPLVYGYSASEAKEKAYHLKVMYKDTDPMTNVLYELEDGTNFGPLIFLDSDSSKVISPPSTLTNGKVFYIIVPLKTGREVKNYKDVLAISGIWQGNNTGKIRKVPEQRVVIDDTGINKYIKVTANPAYGGVANPASYSVDLTMNINHTGLSVSYDPTDVQARYLVTTEPNYDKAVAAMPVDKWPFLNVAATNGTNVTTNVSLADKTTGTWYIHWFVISGPVYAHSLSVVGPPPALYGGFGPYSVISVNTDLISTFEYGTVDVDIFGNDILGSFMPASAIDAITLHPKAGELIDNGQQLIYKHIGGSTLTHEVDSFAYRVNIGGTHFDAKAYIYVIRSKNGGFATTKGNYTINLLPTSNVTFSWFDGAGTPLVPATGHTRTFNVQADMPLQIAPRRTTNPYSQYVFPPAPFTIRAFDTTPQMKWTGAVNTDWHNPENWVMVDNGMEVTVDWIPSGTTDVIIPSGSYNYPELRREASCHSITLEDRAMIAGIHWLNYNDASVELVLTSAEKDRFVMMSAPLESMYSGDYHYKNNANNIQLGDVYMNLFQHANPAGGAAAAANSFTATFGELGKPLTLGTAFNVQVLNSSANYGKPFVFPRTETQYIDKDNRTYNVSRTNADKFIADNRIVLASDSTFQMDVHNDIAGSELVQVVNPYMAYLDVSKFLQANSSLLGNSYAIWNGDVTQGFIQVIPGPVGEGNRYRITNNSSLAWETGGLISPLQSFFVTKKSTAKISKVKMSPNWTTTVGPSPYELRSADNEERNILRVKAVQGDKTSFAVLHNDPSASVGYDAGEDMPKLFYDEIPFEVYWLTSDNKPLAINSMGDFSGSVKLGVWIKEEGPVTLNFDRFAGFNQDVYLIDNQLKGKDREINLQSTSSYTFNASKASEDDAFTYLNDRFTLRFDYNPIANEYVTDSKLQVYAKDGVIHIRSNGDEISQVTIYDVNGSLVNRTQAPSAEYQIPASRQKAYLVKGIVGGKEYVQKVFVD